MDMFDSTLILVASALFFSLLVERLLELVKAVYDFLEVHYGWLEYWNRRARKVSEQLHACMQGKLLQKEISKAVRNYLRADYPGLEGVQAVSADSLRSLTIKAVSKMLGIILGLLIAWGLSINVFELIEKLNQLVAEDNGKSTVVQTYFSTQYISGWLGQTLSGIAIGLGSSPVHKIISSLEKSRKGRTEKSSG